MPTPLVDLSVANYLSTLAARTSTPGGGTAAALTAAQGVSLLSMVCEFTRPESEPLAVIKQECASTQKTLLRLAQEDADAFKNVMKWYKEPNNDNYQQAVEGAITVSINIMREASKLIDVGDYLAENGNKNLITDVAIGANFLACAIQCALVNVLINCRSVSNDVIRTQANQETKKILDVAERLNSIYLRIRGNL